MITDLGTLVDLHAATGINSSRQIVGSSEINNDPAPPTHAFLYSGGVMTDLGTLGGSFSQAWGINVSGQVVGDSEIGGQVHGFL